MSSADEPRVDADYLLRAKRATHHALGEMREGQPHEPAMVERINKPGETPARNRDHAGRFVQKVLKEKKRK